MRYRPFIFAPDTNDPDGGPLIRIDEPGSSSVGFQSTLPASDSAPLLYDARENPVTLSRRRPGFDLTRLRR